MKQKLFLVLASFAVLFALVYFLEDKQENVSETSYWKKQWATIAFYPPSKTWCGETGITFVSEPLVFRAYSRGWNKAPLFTVGFEREGVSYFYEGNFNVRNSFTELGNLKTKWIDTYQKEYATKFCLAEDSPKILLSEDVKAHPNAEKGTGFQKIYFGNKLGSDTSRVIVRSENEIIAPYNYLLEKFRTNSLQFRERNFLVMQNGYVSSLEFQSNLGTTRIENRAKKNQYNSYVNDWSRTTGERLVLPPDVGNAWESAIRNLKVELYPDEEKGKMVLDQIRMTEEAKLKVSLSDGYDLVLHFFPKIRLEQETWRPVRKEIPGIFQESFSFLPETSYENLIQSISKVKSASRYERPTQKIQ